MSIWHSSRSSPTPHSYAESGSCSTACAGSDFLTFLDTARAIAAGVSDPQSYGWSWQGPLSDPPRAADVTQGSVASRDICRQHGTRPTNDLALVPDRYEPIRCSRWTPSPRLSGRSIRDSGCGHLVSAENLSIPILLAIAYLLISGTPSWRLPVLGVLTCGLVFVRPTMLFYVLIVGFTVMALALRPVGRAWRRLYWCVIRRFDSCKRHRRPIRRR